jgi:hypothetical protein
MTARSIASSWLSVGGALAVALGGCSSKSSNQGAGTGTGGISVAGPAGTFTGGIGGISGTGGVGVNPPVAGTGALGGAGGASGSTAGTGAGGTGTSGTGGGTDSNLSTVACTITPSLMMSSAIVTVGIVTFTTDLTGIDSAHIDFGLDTNYGMTAPVDLTQTNYRTLLLGMKPSHDYHYRIVATAGGAQCVGSDNMLHTGDLPNGTHLQPVTINTPQPSKVTPGFIITGFFTAPGSSGVGGFGGTGSGNSAGTAWTCRSSTSTASSATATTT